MSQTAKRQNFLMRLLIKDISVPQMCLYVFGMFIGLFIIVVSIQLYQDFKVSEEASTGESNYLVVSRKVDGVNFTRPKSLATELDSLVAQPWVKKAAMFTPANFNISATVEFAGHGMSSALFFESVPDEFLDILPKEWRFDTNDYDAVLPIIVPRDYLALYNFGFAGARGLPSVGEDVLKTIPIMISISGKGRQQYIEARIVGFSSRLNTIAVPQEFMEWANERFGDRGTSKGSRMIAEISLPSNDERVTSFAESHGLDIGGFNKLAGSTNRILRIVSSGVVGIGSIIAALAIAFLILSIFLLLHKSRLVIYRLIAVGYHPFDIVKIYLFILATLNFLTAALTIGVLAIVEARFSGMMEHYGFGSGSSIFWSSLVAIVAMVFITLMNLMIVRKTVYKISDP